MKINHEHYAGMYAPQLDLYRSVLRRNGIKVEAVLVFYAVLGCVVSCHLKIKHR